MSRFSCALKTAKHDNGRRLGGKLDLIVFGSHELREFGVYYFNDLLCGGEAFENFRSRCLFRDRRDEIFDDHVVDVCGKQRKFDLAHDLFDVVFGQFSF